MTIVVVLAAGMGKRLQLEPVAPKWLAPIGQTTPMAAQLNAVERAGLESVTALVSPGRSGRKVVEAAISPWRDRLDLRLLENPRFADRNNWYSLLLGLRAHEGEDVLVFNSDLFASVDWLARSARSLLATDCGAGLLVDDVASVTEEAMKVSADRGGLLAGIGKVGIEHPVGEYVGLSWWSAEAARDLAEHLARFEGDPTCADKWYEHAIGDHVAAGGEYRLVSAPSSDWVEIDDPTDLRRAVALIEKR